MPKKLTTPEWVDKAVAVHGDVYSYELVDYTGCYNKVKIICSMHGIFEKSPRAHLTGGGCQKCCEYIPSVEHFINRARKAHGDLYDYSLVQDYKSNKHKVKIICPTHGVFSQTASDHTNGKHGCPDCSVDTRKSNAIDFSKKAIAVHGNYYDYSKVIYILSKFKVEIVCKVHGSFWQHPKNHLEGKGCYECFGNKPLNTELWISLAEEAHDEEYDYSKSIYKNRRTKVIVVCKKHGEFKQYPLGHLKSNNPCKDCANEARCLTTEEWRKKAKEFHGDTYDYSRSIYLSAVDKIEIICKKHGSFSIQASSHLRGSGCPICKQSHLESIAERVLENLNLDYEREVKVEGLPRYRFDFYLRKYRTFLEMDGIQHFKTTPNNFFGGEEALKKRQERDAKKNKFAKENGYALIRVPYNADPSPREFLESQLHKIISDF